MIEVAIVKDSYCNRSEIIYTAAMVNLQNQLSNYYI